VNTSLFLDYKIRQAELYLRFADFVSIKTFVDEALVFCPIPPDRQNPFMCRCAIRLLILQIEMADHAGLTDEIFALYDRARSIPSTSLNARQTATLTRLDGIRRLRARDFPAARTAFWESFTKFNDAGVDKRLHCLQYCALAALCAHELISVFASPEAISFSVHPVTAPIAQLTLAYLEANFVKFNQGLDSAKKSFGNDPLYNSMLDGVRVFVLEKQLKIYCQSFCSFDVAFAAEELNTSTEEVRKVIEALILRDELPALIDGVTGKIVMKTPVVRSPYMTHVWDLVSGLEKLVGDLEKLYP
jgi:hypothetical protein